MKNFFNLKHLAFALLSSGLLIATPLTAKEKAKPGYSVDGRTSASVLAAKRSHEVAKEDEIGLSVFSGIFVIAVIGFFAKNHFDNK